MNEFKTVPVVPTEAMLTNNKMPHHKQARIMAEKEMFYSNLALCYIDLCEQLDRAHIELKQAKASPAPDGEVVYQKRMADSWIDISKQEFETCNALGRITRAFNHAPPRVVDVELRESLHNAVALFRPFCTDSTQTLWLEQATKALEQSK